MRAGTHSAEVILRDYSDRLANGVAIFAGHGNNGGDAYIVAAQLAKVGVDVRMVASESPRTDDARRAVALATRYCGGEWKTPTGDERLLVDGLLGTGQRGALRDSVARHAQFIATARSHGAIIVSLDIPTGLDATTGAVAAGAVSAHCTITYGTVKRGLLLARGLAGRVVLVDIGLGEHAQLNDGAWHLADDRAIATRVPRIEWDAHKGRRGRLALVGGVTGMAGAIVLATRASLASGIGVAHAWVDGVGAMALQQTVPQAIAHAWSDSTRALPVWGDALAIGPGLGRGAQSLRMLRHVLDTSENLPAVLDADALTLVSLEAGDIARRLRDWCGETREIVCTPHPGEFARLIGEPVGDSIDVRVRQLADFARAVRATVLLKGTPTLLASFTKEHDVEITAIPRGSAVLATGGSGDVLTGVIGTLLAQKLSCFDAALVGASVHGRAAERVAAWHTGIRGASLGDVLLELPSSWEELAGTHSVLTSSSATTSRAILLELPSPSLEYSSHARHTRRAAGVSTR